MRREIVYLDDTKMIEERLRETALRIAHLLSLR